MIIPKIHIRIFLQTLLIFTIISVSVGSLLHYAIQRNNTTLARYNRFTTLHNNCRDSELFYLGAHDTSRAYKWEKQAESYTDSLNN